jgi:uncharacterized membrane protein (DUF106 family)
MAEFFGLGICFVLVLLIVGVPIGLVVVILTMNSNKRRRLQELEDAYDECLEDLRHSSKKRDLRIKALQAGRAYADEARRQAGARGRAIFDEVALQNDLSAYGG